MVLRRRDLARSGPALERRLIALPWLNKAHHSDPGWIVHHSKFGALITVVGQIRSSDDVRFTTALPPKADRFSNIALLAKAS
jgi:hypothetical protein